MKLVVLVDFDERVQREFGGPLHQPRELVPTKGRNNQKDTVSAGRFRFEQLVFGNDEILSQQRDVDGLSNSSQMVSDPSKKVGSVSTDKATAPALA